MAGLDNDDDEADDVALVDETGVETEMAEVVDDLDDETLVEVTGTVLLELVLLGRSDADVKDEVEDAVMDVEELDRETDDEDEGDEDDKEDEDDVEPPAVPTRYTFILQLPPHDWSRSPPQRAEHSLSGARQLLDLELSSLAQWHCVECCRPAYLNPRVAQPDSHMDRVMAEWENDAEGRRRLLPSVQQPSEPVLSAPMYGFVRPPVDAVERMVATLLPPQIWPELPEHLVVQVVADVEGLALPQVQASRTSALELCRGRVKED